MDLAEGTHDDLSWAQASRPIYPEEPCGDACLVRPFDGGCLTAVIDGGGHGMPAAAASRVAVARLELSVVMWLDDASDMEVRQALGPARLCEQCHRALRASRGAAVNIALLLEPAEDGSRIMIWGGVGNVRGFLERDGQPRRQLPVSDGSCGRYLPEDIPVETLTVRPGDTLVMATDGCERAITREPLPSGPAVSDRARAYLHDYRRGGDDCMVLVLQPMQSMA